MRERRADRARVFGDIVDLVASSTGAAFAAIGISERGSLQVEAATLPVPADAPILDGALAAHALAGGEPVVVLDGDADRRFSALSLPGASRELRFYAVVPIAFRAEHPSGVLLVADFEPRERFPTEHLSAMEKFAGLVADKLASAGLGRESEPANGTGGRDDDMSLGSAQRFEALTNLIPQIVWSTRPDGYHDYFNERWYAYTGMPRTGDQGWNWQDYLHPDDVERTVELWNEALATGLPYDVTYRFRRASDGEYRWFIGRAMPLRNASGQIARWFGTCTDVHEERQAEERLERLAEFRRAAMSLVEDGLTAHRPEDFYQQVVQRAVDVIPGAEAGSVLVRAADGMFEFAASVGYDLERLQQVRLTDEQVGYGAIRSSQPELMTKLELADSLEPEQREVLWTAGRIREIKVALSMPVVLDGVVAAQLSLDNFQSPDAFGEEATEMARVFAGYVATLVQRFRLERQLHRLAFEDALTGLPNRKAISDRIVEALAWADDVVGTVAVLFVDLDGFKAVNDTLGHRAGDEVLQAVAGRLSGSTRADEAVGRLGGDEFAVVLRGMDARHEAKIVAERILHAVAGPIVTRDGTVHVTGSVGIAVYPPDGTTLEDMLRSADMAMYRAKRQGANTFSYFDRDSALAVAE